MASRTPERVIDVVPGLVRGQKRNVRCVYDRRAKQELVSTTRVSTYPYDPEFDLEITGNGLMYIQPRE